VFPPGTVAILPVNGSALDAVGVSRTSYPWRLNHIHITLLMLDAVGTLTVGATLQVECSNFARTKPSLDIRSVKVLLDDPECIERRDCSPGVETRAGAWSPATVGGAVEDWVGDQATLPAWRRSGRVACALMYYVNTAEFNVDVMHFDYPAASESRAVTIGGEFRRSYAPRRGQWHPPEKVGDDTALAERKEDP